MFKYGTTIFSIIILLIIGSIALFGFWNFGFMGFDNHAICSLLVDGAQCSPGSVTHHLALFNAVTVAVFNNSTLLLVCLLLIAPVVFALGVSISRSTYTLLHSFPHHTRRRRTVHHRSLQWLYCWLSLHNKRERRAV